MAPPPRRSAKQGTAREEQVKAFRELTQRIHDAGLMKRRYGFYWIMMVGLTLTLAGIAVAVVFLGDTWYQLLLAGLMGVVMAQVAFLGHEAAHQQIFNSRRWNDWTGRVLSGLFSGLSYGWWMDKHTRHHGNPNKQGKDPDIDSEVLAFTPEATDTRTGLRARLARRQGYFFLPLLFLEGFNLHAASVKTLLRNPAVKHRWTEFAFISLRILGYLAFLFLILPAGIAAAFVGVQVGVFGFLLGAAFATNHIGMPTVPSDVKIDFLRRQVLMSRNVRGGPFVHFALGGLEYQIEHHLFPSLPRPNLRAAQRMVREHCAQYEVPYTETSLWQAFSTVLRYLNQVGSKNRSPFTCPLVQQYRG